MCIRAFMLYPFSFFLRNIAASLRAKLFGCTYRYSHIWPLSCAAASFSDWVWASSETSMSLTYGIAVKIFSSAQLIEVLHWRRALRWWALRWGSFSEGKRVRSVWVFVVVEWCVGIAPHLWVNLHDDNIRPWMWLRVSVRFTFSFPDLFFLLNLLLVSNFQLQSILFHVWMFLFWGGTSWYPLLVLFFGMFNFSQLSVFADILKSVFGL